MKNLSLKQLPLKQLVRAAVIAAVYAALTLAFSGISYGTVQFRVSEVLTVLPFFLPEAVWGLTIGCFFANIFSPELGILDLIFGTLATLLAALVTRRIKHYYLVPIPTILFNAVIVGLMITFTSGVPATLFLFLTSAGFVALGETVVCYIGGIPFLFAWQKLSKRFSFLR
ncbi:MAG: QueT transporter family protein [Clostridia bacterium]|nr:QueT transporter family protein [Clostridia bacterium]